MSDQQSQQAPRPPPVAECDVCDARAVSSCLECRYLFCMFHARQHISSEEGHTLKDLVIPQRWQQQDPDASPKHQTPAPGMKRDQGVRASRKDFKPQKEAQTRSSDQSHRRPSMKSNESNNSGLNLQEKETSMYGLHRSQRSPSMRSSKSINSRPDLKEEELRVCQSDHYTFASTTTQQASSTPAMPSLPVRPTPLSNSLTTLPVTPQQDFYRLVLQHFRTIEEELKEVKQQVAVNTSMLQKLGGGGVADLGLVEDNKLALSNVEDLDELERRLASDAHLKNQLVDKLAILGGKTTKDAVTPCPNYKRRDRMSATKSVPSQYFQLECPDKLL